jgi:hypothetical protein
MKKIISLLLVFPLWGLGVLYAQKELWGVNTGSEYSVNDPAAYFGNITKYDINGENPVIMHEFDLIHGAIPKGILFLASNGKLYGTTRFGGNFLFNGAGNVYAGVLFEYDLILNKYTVLHYFNIDTIGEGYNPIIGVIEPTPGILIGATANRIFKYNVATQTISFSNIIPTNFIFDELMIASNGFIYGTSSIGNCTSTIANEPNQGTIFRYNLGTNTVTTLFTYSCSGNNGTAPTRLVEISPGILLGTNLVGGIHTMTNPFLRGGTIFQFNLNTNVFTTKIDFDYSLHGVKPINLVKGDNGKLYGLCEEGGIPPGNTSTNLFDFRGTLYEYTPATNTIVVKQYFGTTLGNDVRYPTSLMKTTLGTFIGTIPNGGLFRWDAGTNTITIPNSLGAPNNSFNNANLIEICRKPSYHEFTPDTFAPESGSTFTYDIQNTNATTYVWKKGNVVLPAQTTAVLNLPNITQADSGVYTCTMSNECGTTVTMNLFINVDNLSISFDDYFKNKINLYPNPTQNNLNIELPKNIDVTIKTIKIANSLGQLVREQNNTNTTIDVSQLQTGMYFITMETNYGNWKGKFIKE